MSTQKQSNTTCCHLFSQCEYSRRIKSVLETYHRKTFDTPSKSPLQQTNQLITNISPSYSNVKLLNDFYHIKYDHRTNDDPDQFIAFYQYLFNNNDALICNINCCYSATRYYDQRQINPPINDCSENVNDFISLNLLCRIHTYFLHSYEYSQLTEHEIAYIQQLNERKIDHEDIHNDNANTSTSSAVHGRKEKFSSIMRLRYKIKFASESDPNIYYKKMSYLLKNNGFHINGNQLETAFNNYGYDKRLLIDDLCDVIVRSTDNDTTLSQVFTSELHYKNVGERLEIYAVILYQYFQKQDLNNCNFIKLLIMTALETNSNINVNEIEEIARNANLCGKCITKGTIQCVNSVKFGKIFKEMCKWDKKEWSKIYVKMIQKWKLPHSYYNPIVPILKKYTISVDRNRLKNAFDENRYDKQELINDLCDVFAKATDMNTVLKTIFVNKLNFTDENERLKIYDIILHEFIQKHELNNCNFIKVLKKYALNVNSTIDCNKIGEIAKNRNLNGKLFNKGEVEFCNSIKFATIFNKIENWDKKQFTKIYRDINQWKLNAHSKCPIISGEQKEEKKTQIKLYDHDDNDYINKGTDGYKLNIFCAFTKTKDTVAIAFLKKCNWNIENAINIYYAFDGDISKFNFDISNDEDIKSPTMIYNVGIELWYWKSQKNNKRYIEKQFTDLKEEITHFNQFTIKEWNQLCAECNILIQTDKIKMLSSNGNHEHIYAINAGGTITMQHLLSIKLYTDYTTLCKIFCKAFRLKKMVENEYERVESLMHRISKVANWARLLTEAVQCYGKVISTNKLFYRGIDSEFMFKKFVTRFYVPLSTTTNFKMATEFTEGTNGLIMELKRYNEYVSCLNCSLFSNFDTERETLFFGGQSILQINNIWQLYKSIWSSYKKYIKGIQCILNLANGSIKWYRTNNIKEIIEYLLPHTPSDTKSLPQYITSLLHYHLKQLPSKIEIDFRTLRHEYFWVRDIFVANRSIPKISNVCNLFNNCKHMVFIMPNDEMLTDDQCLSVVEDACKIINRDIAIEFHWKTSQSLKQIKMSFDKAAEQIHSSIHGAHVDISRNSVFILPIVEKTLLNAPNHCKIKRNDSFDIIVYGFIHQIQNQCNNSYQIPDHLIKTCCEFYDCFLHLQDKTKATPFTVLFTMYQMQLALLIEGWNLIDTARQCSYLEQHKIDTDIKRKRTAKELVENICHYSETKLKLLVYGQIMTMLRKLQNNSRLWKSKDIYEWSYSDIASSFVFHLINKAKMETKSDPLIWNFVSIFRAYCRNTFHNNMADFWKQSERWKLFNGLLRLERICVKCDLDMNSIPSGNLRDCMREWTTDLSDAAFHGKDIRSEFRKTTKREMSTILWQNEVKSTMNKVMKGKVQLFGLQSTRPKIIISMCDVSKIAKWFGFSGMLELRERGGIVYTGLDRNIAFSSHAAYFKCPLSTSSSYAVAVSFAANDGIILELTQYPSVSRYFHVSRISVHAHIQEKPTKILRKKMYNKRQMYSKRHISGFKAYPKQHKTYRNNKRKFKYNRW
eukprot:190588_1